MTELKYLHLPYKELTGLPGQISALTNLIKMALSHNKISSLPASIVGLTPDSVLKGACPMRRHRGENTHRALSGFKCEIS